MNDMEMDEVIYLLMDELEKLLEKEEKIVDDWHNHVPLGRKPSRKFDEDNVWYSRAEYR
jgi:hypothetical protein